MSETSNPEYCQTELVEVGPPRAPWRVDGQTAAQLMELAVPNVLGDDFVVMCQTEGCERRCRVQPVKGTENPSVLVLGRSGVCSVITEQVHRFMESDL